ncbi:tautomerase family protein [Dehalogenimonas alkenigignens]|jgi:4-oxalocrotonate tautomerase|uniref:4-oxalocrotonate tautomerase family protein n=1 Tax=Dehalogenimonas alkenigignens TaxID=1217799 RepID=A0A0W0GJ42_9CHLR|nr:tautomerase family protein [Dehalogenimonas alkenigignens]KTB48573.1 4-oxalocrotonate tautomerase family protein [Dehalogenimonas alkenigignens]PVV84986.1 4-oxalocrotonate tautomerase [Dehalogenimonas alkenigignens]
MPVVTIEMHEGRTIAQKKQLSEGITREFEKIGTAPEKVTIIFRDVPKYNWSTGGRLAAETLAKPL